jgi:hypothetical protein
VVPKNTGFPDQVDRLGGLEFPSDADIHKVRAEDIPLLASQIARSGREILAIRATTLWTNGCCRESVV